MKRFLSLCSVWAFMLLLILQSCTKPYLTVTPSSLAFSADGGAQTIQVSSNKPWTASVNGSGFSVSPLSGTGDASVAVKASAAILTDPSEGSVVFTCEGLSATVSLKQDSKPAIIVGNPTKVPAEGGTFTVDIQYNTEHVVEIESAAQSWITFNGTRALTSGKLEFTFAANDNTDSRTGKVTVKDRNGKVSPVTITFEQEEKKVIQVGDVELVPFEGGTFEVDIEYNADLSVAVDPAAAGWIEFVRTRALTSGKLEFLFALNESGQPRSGKVTVSSKTGGANPVIITFTQEANGVLSESRELLMQFFDAMGGPAWKNRDGWGTDADIWLWNGVSGDARSGVTGLSFYGNGLKGNLPEMIAEFTNLEVLSLHNEPGVTGTLPSTFANLRNLKYLSVSQTSMTSLSDVFADMKSLSNVEIAMNEKMTGPLPESLGNSPVMERLSFSSNMFTGGIPDSWGGLCGKFLVSMNCLTGKLPASILATREYAWLMEDVLNQREGYGFDISDAEIHGGKYWPKGMVEDLAGGASFSFEDIISKNKCTIFFVWSPGDFYSKRLMNELKDFYDLYHQDGLDIIATVMGSENDIRPDDQRNAIIKNGYDRWHNYYYPAYSDGSFLMTIPCVEVYDSNGNIIFSDFFSFPDPVRQRFDKKTVVETVPFLLDKFELVPYTSTDYSKDGEVKTLQTATVGNGINIVFMGDAFTDRDMGEGGFYDTIMHQSMEEFFAIEPYKSFRNRFNVYQVKVVSPNGRLGDKYTTALESSIADGSSSIDGDAEKAEVYSLKVPSITSTNNLLTCVMVRDQRYAGTCRMAGSKHSAVAFTATEVYDGEYFGSTLRHEAGGHGFGFLSDEYWDYNESVPDSKKENYLSLYEQYGLYSNVDFTGDPSKVHWSAFLSDNRYKDEVGVYEGGALYRFGVWRPSENSMMNQNVEYFNAPSRWAIYKRIMELSGETASFEKFLEYDAVNRGTRSAARPPLRSAANNVVRHTAPPIIVP